MKELVIELFDLEREYFSVILLPIVRDDKSTPDSTLEYDEEQPRR